MDRDPLTWASNAGESEKNRDCRPLSQFYLGNGRRYGHSYYRTPIGTHTIYQMVPLSMTLINP